MPFCFRKKSQRSRGWCAWRCWSFIRIATFGLVRFQGPLIHEWYEVLRHLGKSLLVSTWWKRQGGQVNYIWDAHSQRGRLSCLIPFWKARLIHVGKRQPRTLCQLGPYLGLTDLHIKIRKQPGLRNSTTQLKSTDHCKIHIFLYINSLNPLVGICWDVNQLTPFSSLQ